MSKQTAVEWLEEQLKKGVDFNPLDKNSYLNNVEKLFDHAKAMEKEQITIAYQSDRILCFDEVAEEYYNETYGGDK